VLFLPDGAQGAALSVTRLSELRQIKTQYFCHDLILSILEILAPGVVTLLSRVSPRSRGTPVMAPLCTNCARIEPFYFIRLALSEKQMPQVVENIGDQDREWSYWRGLRCFASRGSPVRSRPRPPNSDLKALVKFISTQSLSFGSNCARMRLLQCDCVHWRGRQNVSDHRLYFVGSTVELFQSFALHLQLHLGILSCGIHGRRHPRAKPWHPANASNAEQSGSHGASRVPKSFLRHVHEVKY